MIEVCCGVDCGPCSGTPCREKMVREFGGCPAECAPRISIDKGLCNGCKTYRPNRMSKKQERRAKVEERKRSRFT
jgi:hypothetical protein